MSRHHPRPPPTPRQPGGRASNMLKAVMASAQQQHQAGQLEAAGKLYRQALALEPRQAECLHLLGVIALQTGRLDDAATLIGQAIAIDPRVASYHANLGTVLMQQARLDDAVASFQRALTLQKNFAGAQFNLGNALRALKRPEQALSCYRAALALEPNLPGGDYNMGLAHAELGQFEASIACYRRAIAAQPAFASAQNNLGNALCALGRPDEAIDAYRRALALQPDFADAMNNLAIALTERGCLDEAMRLCRQALALQPDTAEIHNNLGNILAERMQLDEAVACYRRAIRLRPDFANAHSNLAARLLALGSLDEGWSEFEWRWQTPHLRTADRGFRQPPWRGEALVGATVLITAEQGLGDTLQFCRYAPLVANLGMRVMIEVQPPLARLLRCLPGIDRVLARGEPLPAFDVHCPMVSLPLAFSTTLASIPADIPYLRAQDADVAAWRARLAAMTGPGPRVGLVWAGNPRSRFSDLAAIDRRRSIDPARLAPLFDVPGIQFLSLQKDGPPPPAAFPIIDVMAEMGDFADTAALVANLDLVISVDTSVAHLAAAMGRPVWMLDRFDACWRWLIGQRDSPWYPTLRLYRQPSSGDWDPPVAEIAQDLRAFSTQGAVQNVPSTHK